MADYWDVGLGHAPTQKVIGSSIERAAAAVAVVGEEVVVVV
jgi:hypothetical protein